MEFVKGEVSSKLHGNIKARLLNEKSNFIASKIKSEFFHLDNPGALNISNFLEAADLRVQNTSHIDIKRLGLSGSGFFNLKKSDLNLNSVFIGNYGKA